MSIRMGKLYKQAKEYEMQLVAGEAGLDNIINWVHMIEDEQVADFLRGNELVFTTGIAHHNELWLEGFVQRLIRNQASGLVVNIGPYIGAVPGPVIDYCERHDFPLFTIPWKIRLVDVTRDFCRRIINSEQTEMSISSALKNAIFFPEEIANQAQLERRGFNANWNYCAIAMSVRSASDSRHQQNLADIRFHAENSINRVSDKYSIFSQENQLIIVLANFEDKGIAACVNAMVAHGELRGPDYTLHLGIGQNETGLNLLAKSYKQAAAVLRMAEKNNWRKVYYKELGIYKILLSVEDDNVLHEMYDDTLGRLADYDLANKTDYMNILKYYLENDASVQVVAKLTFVHRNTINYKLSKIREITGHDIASIEDRLRMMLAFKIKDIR